MLSIGQRRVPRFGPEAVLPWQDGEEKRADTFALLQQSGWLPL